MEGLGITDIKDSEASGPSAQTSTKKKIAELTSSNSRLRVEASATKRRLLEVERKLEMLDENQVAKVIEATMEDAKKMHEQYRVAFSKLCIATELRYFLRGDIKRQAVVLAGVVKAYDLNDKFWSGMFDCTLAELEPVFFEIGEESGVLNERDITSH
jgi:hypothetical protein